jgi:hypothetical protein
MTQAVKTSLLDILLAFTAFATAIAEYFPPPFFILEGRSGIFQ